MEQAFHPLFEFDESSEIDDLEHFGDQPLPDREFHLDAFPGIGESLFDPQGNFSSLLVDFQNLDLDFIPFAQLFARMIDPSIGDVFLVYQSFDASEVDEGAVFDHRCHHSLDDVSRFQDLQHFLDFFFLFLFKQDPAGEGAVHLLFVELGDLEQEFLAQQLFGRLCLDDIHLAHRQEHGDAHVHDESVFLGGELDDSPGQRGVFLEGPHDFFPSLLDIDLFLGNDDIPFPAVPAHRQNGDGIAHLVFDGPVPVEKFGFFQHAFRFLSDIDHHPVGRDFDDPTFHRRIGIQVFQVVVFHHLRKIFFGLLDVRISFVRHGSSPCLY